MTTFLKCFKKCGCCGETNHILVVGSTNAFGSCDLDMRPPGMQRGAMFSCMQICDHCGYAAWDLEEEIQPSDELKKILSEKIDADDMVKVFERAARIAALKGSEKKNVDDLYLIAAWAADDRKDAATAAAMRKKILSGISPEDDVSPEMLLRLVDIARRAGESETARALLKRLDECELAPLLKSIATFQSELLDNDDTACYTVANVCHCVKRNQ